MKRTDDVPHRRGWAFGLWVRKDGEFKVAIFHTGSGVGAWAHGSTREDATVDAQRQIDAIYATRITTLGEAEPGDEAVTIHV